MKRILAMAAGLVLLMGSLAPAAVITVSKNAADNANASTINGAVDLANSGDTIRILDSATYSEDFRKPFNMKGNGTVLDSLFVEAAAGQTPTLEKNSGAVCPVAQFGPKDATSTVTGPFAIRGASPTARMTLRILNQTNPLIATGSNTNSPHSITAENLILEKPTDPAVTASTLLFVNFFNSASHTLTNITLKGRKLDDATNMVQLGCTQGNTITVNNMDFSAANGKDLQMINWVGVNLSSGNLVFNDCNFTLSQASRDAGQRVSILRDRVADAVNGTTTFNNCRFNTGGSGGATPNYGPRGFDFGVDATVVLNNPVFESGLGDIAFHLNNTNLGAADKYPTLTIAGTPTNKVNLDPIFANGALPFRVLQGTVNLIDCKATVASSTNALLDTTFEGAAVGPININLNRCIFGDNCGNIVPAFRTADTGVDLNSPEAINITATNTIWAGGSQRGAIIERIPDGTGKVHGAMTLALTHCTMLGKTANILVGLETADPSPVANYCIFDTSQTPSKAANGTHALTGKGNLCWTGNGAANPAAWWVGEPAGTLHLDPKLDATGHIATDSLVGAAATGSTMTIDVDGQARPDGGTTPDIGADENRSVPVELSGFAVE